GRCGRLVALPAGRRRPLRHEEAHALDPLVTLQQFGDLGPQGRVPGALPVEVRRPLPGGQFHGGGEELEPPVAVVGAHALSPRCRYSQARAKRSSRSAVVTETSSCSATSAMLKPPKKRSVRTWLDRSCAVASSSSASWRASTSTFCRS